jgi:hypothetical protein
MLGSRGIDVFADGGRKAGRGSDLGGRITLGWRDLARGLGADGLRTAHSLRRSACRPVIRPRAASKSPVKTRG